MRPVVFAFRGQQSINGGGADIEEPTSHHRVELKMTVPFHRFDQHGDENSEPLAADAIGRFPQHR
jgi:hypothetical protein